MTQSSGKEIFNDTICSDLEFCKTWYDFLDTYSIANRGAYISAENIDKLKKCFGLLIDYLSKEDKEDDERIAW